MNFRRTAIFVGLNLIAVLATQATPVRFASDSRQTHLVELYTSEGCSSCPPAEAWLGEQRDAPGLWRDFVPVAFHVDYWNRLGWTDRWSKPSFTQREYALAQAWRSESVYTPCFVLDGREWRPGGARPVPVAGPSRAGQLTAEYDQGTLRVRFDAATSGNFEIHAAVLGGGIESVVRAGENRGRTLRHDFIVLSLQTAPLRNGTAQVDLALPADRAVKRRALAVWVTRAGDLTPLQATGGWLD